MKYWDTSIIQKALAILKWVLHSKVEITFSFPFPYILAPPHPCPQEIYLNSWGVDSGVRVTCFSQDFWMVFHITKPTIRFWKYYFVSLCCLKLSIFKIKFSLLFPATWCNIASTATMTVNAVIWGWIWYKGSSRTQLSRIPLPFSALSGQCTAAGRQSSDHNCSSQSALSLGQPDHTIFSF